MPLTPEEPQIHESVPGPRTAPTSGRSASTPRPVPGPPRPAAPRPAPPRAVAAVGSASGHAGSGRQTGTTGPAVADQATPAAPAVGTAVPPHATDTAQIQLIPAPEDGALDAAEETVDLLLDTGRAPGEILVLTTGGRHPWAAHELSFGESSYWAQYDAADDVFYADIEAPLATGRPVVLVALNGGSDDTLPRALATALARAGVLLIVCGDPTRINSLLGASA